MKENIIIRRMRMKAIRRSVVSVFRLNEKVFPSIKMITCIFLVSEFDDYFDLSFYVFLWIAIRMRVLSSSFFVIPHNIIISRISFSILDSSRIFLEIQCVR